MEVKYTDLQAQELIDNYIRCDIDEIPEDDKWGARDKCINDFMKKHKKSKKSVIAKLSKATHNGVKVYKVKPKVSKVTGTKPETKEQMLEKIAHKLGMDISQLAGIDKGPKLSLQNLLDRLNEGI